MKRRYFMAGMGFGAMSLANASNVNRATTAYAPSINVSVTGDKDGGHRSSKSVRIIGVGGAGCHLLTAMRTSGVLGDNGLCAELIAVDLCPHTLWHVEAANKAMPDRVPIQAKPIAEFGSGGRVYAARAAALRHREALKESVTGIDVVILIAGLGSSTGSGVTPMLAGWSRAAGAQTIVIAMTPFNIGRLGEQSDYALKSLHQNSDRVVHFSNQALGDELGDDATLEEVFATQERRIAAWVQGLNWG